jgi:glyceraldehyde 3-phosphate dehydrogenase
LHRARHHTRGGAKRVLVSAPSKTREDADAFLLPGINLDSYDPEQHKIVSMASCTTNALGPVVKVVMENFGIKYGLFSTVHAYTNTQSLTDQPMKDRRDSWAAAENLIPSSSGAAKALAFIWPGLQITGKAYRIPVRTGSIAELNLLTEQSVTVEAVNDAFRAAAAEGPLKGIMGVLEGEWASSRIVGDPHSSIVDLPLTAVQGAVGCRLVRQRVGLHLAPGRNSRYARGVACLQARYPADHFGGAFVARPCLYRNTEHML